MLNPYTLEDSSIRSQPSEGGESESLAIADAFSGSNNVVPTVQKSRRRKSPDVSTAKDAKTRSKSSESVAIANAFSGSNVVDLDIRTARSPNSHDMGTRKDARSYSKPSESVAIASAFSGFSVEEMDELVARAPKSPKEARSPTKFSEPLAIAHAFSTFTPVDLDVQNARSHKSPDMLTAKEAGSFNDLTEQPVDTSGYDALMEEEDDLVMEIEAPTRLPCGGASVGQAQRSRFNSDFNMNVMP
ncbi:hypothetical protein V3C99_001297 [Haemonchus contortus]